MGLDAIASTRPVDGSIATTAPEWPASPASAARWAGTERLVTMLLPVTVWPCSRSPRLPSTVERSAFDEVR